MLKRTSILQPASQERLESLITMRLKPGADKEHIDRRIWDLFGENWCIMFTDLAGFSRHVARFGIIHFLQTIYESERVCVPVIEEHDGILLKAEGDSLLVIFRNVQKATLAAIEMQRRLRVYNDDKEDEEKVLLCVGLGFGRVLRIGDSDVFGAEVNAASKLGEDIAISHEILVTRAFKDAVGGLPGVVFEATEDDVPGADGTFRARYEVSMPLP